MEREDKIAIIKIIAYMSVLIPLFIILNKAFNTIIATVSVLGIIGLFFGLAIFFHSQDIKEEHKILT